MSLLLGHRYTQKTLSAITDQVLGRVEAFPRGPLLENLPLSPGGRFPEGLQGWVGCGQRGGVRGFRDHPKGKRQILGFWLLLTKNTSAWKKGRRGAMGKDIKGVLLSITVGLSGREGTIFWSYPLAQ